MTSVVLLAAQIAIAQAPLPGEEVFYRAGIDTQQAIWGMRDGIRVAIWPHSVTESPDPGGPRGLLRIGYPVLDDGAFGLVNYIAVEPVVQGSPWRSYSELEHSASDNAPGMLIEAGPPPGVEWNGPAGTLYPGHVEEREGFLSLAVCLRVERFQSGAHVYLIASFRSDRPNEVELRSYREEGSAELQSCILTATMGNYIRLRELHLRDQVLTAQALYGGYEGTGFTEHTVIPLDAMPRTEGGDLLVAATTDEADPASTYPNPDWPWFWHYPGRKVTQYWRKPADDAGDDLRAQVNARRVYWASEWPIPGGVSFENFEMIEEYRPGRPLIFGITPQAPAELLAASE